MCCSFKSVMASSFFLIVSILAFTFDHLSAEREAWGGNGGWWGGGNREWIGDFDGPGYHVSPCHCHCHHNYPYYYNGYYPSCYRNYYTPDSPYYYDSSVPGAGAYFNLRCR